MIPTRYPRRLGVALLALCLLSLQPSSLYAHGGVAFEEDLCVINIGFMRAHFTVFQPETRQSREYCEDIPDVSRAVFVMEYLHGLLSEMAIDFRILRDVNDVGRFADWEDVQAIEDIEAATVYYQEPRIEEGGYYRASHTFDSPGTYIGVVTAEHPEEDRFYRAVFFFQVGGRDWGTLPLFLALLLALQAAYWVGSGGLKRWREKRAASGRASF